MTLADPTGGAGYIFGQTLPAAHMTTIANQQVRALDAVNGGTYTCSNALTWTLNQRASLDFEKGVDVTLSPGPMGSPEGIIVSAEADLLVEDMTGGGTLNTIWGGTFDTKLKTARAVYQAITADGNHTITSSLVKSTMVPTANRSLTLSTNLNLQDGAIIMMRVNNTAVANTITIRDQNAVAIATLAANQGIDNWIQVAVDSSGNGFALAWDNGGGWSIFV